jgi:1,4-dihydroxy-2-naphthoyl-CoA synthase
VPALTLNRPRSRNAVNAQLWAALPDALAAATHDVEVRALVITGASSREITTQESGVTLSEQFVESGGRAHDQQFPVGIGGQEYPVADEA